MPLSSSQNNFQKIEIKFKRVEIEPTSADYQIPSFAIKPKARERKHTIRKVTVPKRALVAAPAAANANDLSLTLMHDNSLGGWSDGQTPGLNIS